MEIEYYYASYSAYAYLGNAEMHAIARRTDATIKYIPMDLRAVMPAAGSQAITERSQSHKDYFFGREMIRWAEHRGLEMMDRTPTHHNNDITLSNCVLIAADKSGADMESLTNVMLYAHWVEDADLDNEADLKDICSRAHVDGDALIATAKTPEIQKIYQSNTDEAIRRYVFGSPTYYVAGDMFYGQDRLQMVERALLKPYKGEWPRK